MKLSDFVWKFVENLGVKHVFMLSGGGSMHLVDSLGRSNLKYICNLHEQACAISAGAYAQYTNKLGVCCVTTGCGGSNAITGVAAAWLDSVPLLVVSGQVKTADLARNGMRQGGFQELNIVKVVEPITKYAVMITDPSSIGYHLRKAVYLATHGRKAPVWIDIPLDIQASEIDEVALKTYGWEMDTIKRNLNMSGVMDLINKSERPVLLLGNGARESNYLSLIDMLKIPVLTTWKATDLLPENHPYYIGRPGAIGQRGANFSQQNSDLIITLGARLDLGQVGYSYANFAPKAKKIIVDIDESEIYKLPNLDMTYIMDTKVFISFLLKEKKTTDHTKWLRKCKEWQRKYPLMEKNYGDGYVDNYELISILSNEMLLDDVLIPSSSGQAAEITLQAFKVKQGQRIINFEGLGSMGFGISSAIGACLASGKRTICIEGDGSFAMNTQELETVHRLKLPIKFFVLNNHGYGSVRNTQNNLFKGFKVGCDETSGVTLPDISKVAQGCGLHYLKVKNHSLKNIIKRVLDYPEAVVCEVMISPSQLTEPRIMSHIVDGHIESDKLENMYPYLSEAEQKANIC